MIYVVFDGIPQNEYQVISTCGGLLGHASIEGMLL